MASIVVDGLKNISSNRLITHSCESPRPFRLGAGHLLKYVKDNLIDTSHARQSRSVNTTCAKIEQHIFYHKMIQSEIFKENRFKTGCDTINLFDFLEKMKRPVWLFEDE